MSRASYNHLTDEEFINLLDFQCNSSPIIKECISRLEKLTAKHTLSEECNTLVECPVCEAELRVELDEDNGLFNLIVTD